MPEQKPDICELDLNALQEALSAWEEPSFRARQVYAWLHQKGAVSFAEMSNLPKPLRERLAAFYRITGMEAAEVFVSRLDGTRKYVFSLSDGNAIEAVWMRYHHGNSVCISSQVGCRMGCRFCASTLDGCARNLTDAEMLAEVYRMEKDIGERVSNIVIMGSGEPLDNYDAVVRFIRRVSSEDGLHISPRNITVSTCGLVPEMNRLSEERLPITLALSLHAASQEKRASIMPIAKKYDLDAVLSACRRYYDKTRRRISFEYSIVRGVNDRREDAEELAALLRSYGFADAPERAGRADGSARKYPGAGYRQIPSGGGKEGRGHVNLIPVNPIEEREYESPDRQTVQDFLKELEMQGVHATIRREMGRDIQSACGQLRRRHIRNAGTGSD